MLIINQTFAQLSDINCYSDEGNARKNMFHGEGKLFLKRLAKELNLAAGTYDIRSNIGGMAVSGEVTLHSDTLYVQLSESCMARGVSVLFRSCKHRGDYTGGQNFHTDMAHLASLSSNRTAWVERLKKLGGLV